MSPQCGDDGCPAPRGTPASSDTTVRSVSLAGQTVIIECRKDGKVLVNGDEVEPAAVTMQRFRDGS